MVGGIVMAFKAIFFCPEHADYCDFTVFSSAGTRSFRLAGGESYVENAGSNDRYVGVVEGDSRSKEHLSQPISPDRNVAFL